MKRIIKYLRYDLGLYLVLLVTGWLPERGVFNRVRGILASPFIKSVGNNFRLGKGVTILCPDRLTIGNNVYFAKNIWINSAGSIFINDGVIISPFCVIDSSKHLFNTIGVTNKAILEKIEIGKGSWIASHTTISLGVTIGNNVLVGANSVVTKDVENCVFIGGVPAKIIKRLSDD